MSIKGSSAQIEGNLLYFIYYYCLHNLKLCLINVYPHPHPHLHTVAVLRHRTHTVSFPSSVIASRGTFLAELSCDTHISTNRVLNANNRPVSMGPAGVRWATTKKRWKKDDDSTNDEPQGVPMGDAKRMGKNSGIALLLPACLDVWRSVLGGVCVCARFSGGERFGNDIAAPWVQNCGRGAVGVGVWGQWQGGVYRDTMMIADRRPILIISGMIKHINSRPRKHCSGTNSLYLFLFLHRFSILFSLPFLSPPKKKNNFRLCEWEVA